MVFYYIRKKREIRRSCWTIEGENFPFPFLIRTFFSVSTACHASRLNSTQNHSLHSTGDSIDRESATVTKIVSVCIYVVYTGKNAYWDSRVMFQRRIAYLFPRTCDIYVLQFAPRSLAVHYPFSHEGLSTERSSLVTMYLAFGEYGWSASTS